jgi:hypothetical protein
MDRIVSLYWNNIDPRIVDAQRRVFAHFGLAVDQRERTGLAHGDFLDAYMAELGEDDVALMVDIDCFPLNRAIVERAFAAAREGRIFGCAQSTNHVDPDRLFVAPMFMAISRRTWDRLGRPSFRPDALNDVAQALCDKAVVAGVEVEMLYPWACVAPKWRLGDVALYGIGTFYRGGVFHLFESRRKIYAFVLLEVAEATIAGRRVDLLSLVDRALPLLVRDQRASRFKRWCKNLWLRRAWRRFRGRAKGMELAEPERSDVGPR